MQLGVGEGSGPGSIHSQRSCRDPGCSEGLDQRPSSKTRVRCKSKRTGSCISVLLTFTLFPFLLSWTRWPLLNEALILVAGIGQTQPIDLTGSSWEHSLLKLPFIPCPNTSGNWNSPGNGPGEGECASHLQTWPPRLRGEAGMDLPDWEGD